MPVSPEARKRPADLHEHSPFKSKSPVAALPESAQDALAKEARDRVHDLYLGLDEVGNDESGVRDLVPKRVATNP